MPDFLDLRNRKLHDIFYAGADVNEANAVVLQPECGEGGELLHGGFLIRGFVGESRKG